MSERRPQESHAASFSSRLSKRKISDTPEKQVLVGDNWWEESLVSQEKAVESLQARAAYWYRQAAPQLSGLSKAKVDKRLAALFDAKSVLTAHRDAGAGGFAGAADWDAAGAFDVAV